MVKKINIINKYNLNTMPRAKVIYTTLAVVLLGGMFFSGYGYLSMQKELTTTRMLLAEEKRDERALNFLGMFVSKVIKAEKEVSFEDRLKLENMVRDLNDESIVKQWKNFVDSKTEKEAQENVKELLDLLVDKISVKK